MDTFSYGDRVSYSEEGIRSLYPKKPKRMGVIANRKRAGRSDCILVKWDGVKSPTSYHKDFIKKVADQKDSDTRYPVVTFKVPYMFKVDIRMTPDVSFIKGADSKRFLLAHLKEKINMMDWVGDEELLSGMGTPKMVAIDRWE